MMASWPAGAATLDSVPSMDVVRGRLNLTPDQEAQLVPLFKRRAGELQQTRSRLEQAAGRQAKRTVLREAKQQGETFNTQVENLLTTPQKSEWREIRKETREKIRERVEEKRDSQ